MTYFVLPILLLSRFNINYLGCGIESCFMLLFTFLLCDVCLEGVSLPLGALDRLQH